MIRPVCWAPRSRIAGTVALTVWTTPSRLTRMTRRHSSAVISRKLGARPGTPAAPVYLNAVLGLATIALYLAFVRLSKQKRRP